MGLGLLYLLRGFDHRQQTTGTLLELAVLGGVDERVDNAVAEHEYSAEVVLPATEVDIESDEGDGN